MAAARLREAVRALGGRSSGPADAAAGPPEDMPAEFLRLYERAAPFTMTSVERMYALWEACRYIGKAGLEGDVVECGVWRGGSSMMAALALRGSEQDRRMWLYDTFEGMPPPSDRDVDYTGASAASTLNEDERVPGVSNNWAWATLDDVESNMAATGYPAELLHYVPGKVEETIPGQAPERIALLRLDTDWYDSTRHELEHLYPRLVSGGVLIIDDYGHWEGARGAVDEYFEGRPVFLGRIDYTGRVLVKP
jgi:O-methyltransferase